MLGISMRIYRRNKLAISQVTAYQLDLQARLSQLFPPATVETEWAAMRVEPGLYSPRLDLAVGPFATDRSCIDEYNALSVIHSELLLALYRTHCANLTAYGE